MSEGTIEYRILGPLEIVASGGRRIEVASPIQRRLLAFLLLSRQSAATIEMLADAAWPEDEPPAPSTVRYHLSMLRDALSPGRDRGDLGPIASVPGGYRLTGARLDADEFEDLARRGRALLAEDPKRAAEILERAAALMARHGHPEIAARLLGAAEQLRADFDMPRPDRDRFVIDRTRADLAAALPEEALERSAETPLTLDQALDLAEAWPGPDIGR